MDWKNKNNSYAAVDVGGTNVRFAIFDENGKIISKVKTSTDYTSAENTCNWIKERILENNIMYLALCIPGPSDYENGIVLNSPNLGGTWKNFDVKQYLLKNTQIKDIVFENDANVMALANHVYYKKNLNDVSQFYTISTGFGSGLIINNKIFHGNNYYAQEIAQIPVSKSAFLGKSRLLNKYALELHCSGSGIETKAKYYDIANSAKEVFELAEKGNIQATKIVNEAKETLMNMFAINAGIIAPHNFFIGGSVALAQKQFVIDAFNLAKEISDPNHFKNINLYFDELGDDSALYGLYNLIKLRNG
ncbi:ROK family protein [Mycoplasmopsis cynos]|uniref:N-acetylmannosamine kinase n=1 Tax=Mycoplasmopsis cynos TaxID=171284 RepID=A0A449AHC6_9BACT|nr:ROK family protein [Mycoplasmopsis cynos]TQC54414.1 ROK family protein [Mycoplasmopsis cynos]WQQ12972.1 ROK family protein [Mycoplasmopsis cynos]WQQ14269.1 ROK family protein [Mycoplasmopsis cynos]WQQ14514.1 ROK family protein [Mycoplasmopsis cynos]WQQ16255.1 ROK family protein [Mycoplasmopsis cynos]